MDFSFSENISSINKDQFDLMVNENDSPFINYDFLYALEESSSVSELSGWKPNHLFSIEDKKLNGFMPLYLKNNSQGEFVFDHSWSYALNRAGRKYYPKLLTAVPFTPCRTRKIISDKPDNFIDAVLDFMEEKNIETWHVLFPEREESKTLLEKGLIERSGHKFIWNNKNYESFDDFLKIFKSRQRKNIKNERKKISDLGITFMVKDSNNITKSDWETFYYFYKNTYDQRLQRPYLNKKFFDLIHDSKNILNPVIIFAYLNDEVIAGSLCYRDKNNLYGRHWGAKYDIDSLHFECCYYQGIDYCIKNNLKEFDPGVQGEHKIRRGFEPKSIFSYHYILQNDFKDAILDFCNREKIENKNYLEACKRYTPFNNEYKI